MALDPALDPARMAGARDVHLPHARPQGGHDGDDRDPGNEQLGWESRSAEGPSHVYNLMDEVTRNFTPVLGNAVLLGQWPSLPVT